jgi:ABC-type multidrug transport system ATPase subunit
VATVELEDVAKSYGDRRAVVGLSLSVASGESVALLGPPAAARPPR